MHVKKNTEKGVIRTGKKVYRLPLPSIYKETKILGGLNGGMEWVLRDYMIYLKHTKDPLPSR